MAFPDKSTRRPRVEQLGLAAGVPTEALRQMLATLVQETIEQLLTALRDAWNAASRDEAEARLARLVATVRKPLPALAAWLEETRRRLRSTNSIELDHAEVRRRTRVIRIFPNEASLLRLTTALAMERNEQWSQRRYIDPEDAATIIRIVEGRIRMRRVVPMA